MNLQKIHTGSTWERQTDERLGYFGEHLFAQLAGAAALDTVQIGVNSTGIPYCHHAR
jgi:hypothetical protein